MKFLVVTMSLMSLSVWANPTTTNIGKPLQKTPTVAFKTAPAKAVPMVPGDKGKMAADCDKAAAKPVEIKPEGLSLSNNSTGCSLDSAK